MSDFEFWSEDRRFGLRISEIHMLSLRRACIAAAPNETGGILIGLYSQAHDCASVTAVSGAPPDSQSGRTWFYRGVQGLQTWLDRLWRRKKQYYLGEWHFHPYSSPVSSEVDIQEMDKTATSKSYRCPEPVLLIIGGDPSKEPELKARVFLRGRKTAELVLVSRP